MTTEWIELPDLQAVAIAQSKDWQIECLPTAAGGWSKWMQCAWNTSWKFRGRPRQPKMKKAKMLCWVDNENELRWVREGDMYIQNTWIRIPAQDIEIEIPEGV